MKNTLGLLLLWPALVSAQPAPIAVSSIKTTDATATSACVGCPLGSTTPAANSGMTAATVVLASGVPSVTTNKLYNNGGALFFNGLSLATGSSISGTTDFIPKFTSSTSLGNSIMQVGVSGLTVGIGAAPSFILDVKQTASAPAINVTEVNGGTNRRATIGFGLNSGATAGWVLGEGFAAGATRDFYILDATAGLARLYIDTSGNVGLGTTAGAAKLSINGGVHVGGDTDPGDNNLNADGTVQWGGGSAITSSNNVALLAAANAFTGGSNSPLRQSYTNSTSGTGAAAGWNLVAGTTSLFLDAFSQGFTTLNSAVASSARLSTGSTGGLNLVSADGGGTIGFWAGGEVRRWTISAAGHFIPNVDNTYTVGDSTHNLTGLFVISGGLTFNAGTTAPSVTVAAPNTTAYFGSNSQVLTTPTVWILVTVNGVQYKVPAY